MIDEILRPELAAVQKRYDTTGKRTRKASPANRPVDLLVTNVADEPIKRRASKHHQQE
jgi:hypothetical protein